MAAFAVAAAGLVGFPLVAGFVSKFHLLVGAAASPHPAFVAAFLVAGLLKLLYFWPIVYAAFFGSRERASPASRHPFAPPHGHGHDRSTGGLGGAGVDAGRTAAGEPTAADGAGDPATVADGGYAGYAEQADRAEQADSVGTAGWEYRTPTTESSAFLLVPVLFTVGVAVVLGVVPTALPFWELAETAVAEVFG
jgi:NADH:ubiquinone oxidoreductase subunit 5 (subunit L)/multisubunit Na+/H+ antiporter MnhA subunit